jgi:PncC family amidohydrolase
MAAGVLAATGADFGISITGIAGPGGGSAEKPVGLVYIGVAKQGQPAYAVPANYWGDRTTIRQRSVQEALVLLHHILSEQEAPQ